jgi:DNA-binding MarR family transcriptional regulator
MQAWLSVVRAYNLCDAAMTQRLAAIGLKLAEHEVLVHLLRTPALTQQQLAQRCFVAKSGISMLLSRMEHDGWVRRTVDDSDARIKRLALTSAGKALAVKSRAIQQAVLSAMVGPASPDELATVARAMVRASTALEDLLQAP